MSFLNRCREFESREVMERLFEDFVKVFQRFMGVCHNVVSIPEKVGNILFLLRIKKKKMEQ